MEEEVLKLGGRKVDARPEHIGPGWWDALHVMGYIQDTSPFENGRDIFIDFVIRGLGLHFLCLHCRSHALEYMTKIDPVKNILQHPATIMGGPPGTPPIPLMVCLAWSYRFHEAVNTRLKKDKAKSPTFSQLEKFLADRRDGKGCTNCGGAPSVTEKPPVVVMSRQVVD